MSFMSTRLSVLVFCVLGFCTCGAGSAERELVMYVQPEVADLVPGFKSGVLKGESVQRALAEATVNQKDWCKNPSQAAGLLRDLTEEEKSAFKLGNPALRAMLGCVSWSNLNDRHPEVSLAHARNLVAPGLAASGVCVSVGFIQPYIMAPVLQCEKLIISDLSFRTMRLHSILLPMLRQREFRGLDQAIKDFALASGENLEELCGKEFVRECKLHLMRFIEYQRNGLRVELRLGAVQKLDFPKSESVRFAYLSNATDPNFMSQADFTELRSRLGAGIGSVAIYHQAESENFGIYEVSGEKIRTICADNFVVSQGGRYSPDNCKYFPPTSRAYKTFFDQAVTDATLPAKCEFAMH